MNFRFYTNAVSQASRSFAAGSFITGLLLIGFGLLVHFLRDFFAIIAAMVFFIAGIGCCITGVKIFLAQKRFERVNRKGPQDYRENVKIHIKENHHQ
jgi:hypothetical protein